MNDSDKSTNKNDGLQNLDNVNDKTQTKQENENRDDISNEIRLHISILQATGLPKLRWFKKPDPYVTIHMMSRPQNLKTTRFKSSTQNPVWNEEFDLITSEVNDTIIINMYHYMDDRKIMDEVQYEISSLTVDGSVDKKEVDITFDNKNVGKFFFDVQAFKIPQSDVKPFCTFSATGEKFANQKFYSCITCGLDTKKGFGICEICAKCCHKGHNICLSNEDGSSTQCFCDCPKKCKCFCMPEKCDLSCTAIENNGKPINQPMYHCSQCDFQCEILICQNCAMKFHHGHQLIFLGIVESGICQNDEFNSFE